MIGIAIDINFRLSWSNLLLVLTRGVNLRLAVLVVALERRDLVLLGDIRHFAVMLRHLSAQLVERLLLVLIAFKHFPGVVHVFLSDLFGCANGSIRNGGRQLALALLSLVHDERLDASKEGLLIHGLGLIVGGEELEHDLIGHGLLNGISRFHGTVGALTSFFGVRHVFEGGY